MWRATFARRIPSAAMGSICVGRTFTRANSAATKNPFNATSSRPRTKPHEGGIALSPWPPPGRAANVIKAGRAGFTGVSP